MDRVYTMDFKSLNSDVNHPTSAEGFTVIFNKARDEKKTGGNPDSPGKTATDPHSKPVVEPGKTQTVRCS
ncbi:hypothetical protein JHK82_050219 [Glycine max]|nr:hypothetical protein JHK82_050219 [Glycine max]